MTHFLTVVEASGLHTAAVSDVQKAARSWAGHDLLIHTETTDASERAIKSSWAESYRVGEILLAWEPATIAVLNKDSVRLTDIAWKVGNISRDGVTAARMHVLHKPTGTEGVVIGLHWPSGVNRFQVRARAHKAASRQLGVVIAQGIAHHPGRWRLVAGDTNLDHHRGPVRALMEKELGIRDLWSQHPVSDNSHDDRLIDAMFVHRLRAHDAGVFGRTPASDHRAIWADYVVS